MTMITILHHRSNSAQTVAADNNLHRLTTSMLLSTSVFVQQFLKSKLSQRCCSSVIQALQSSTAFTSAQNRATVSSGSCTVSSNVFHRVRQKTSLSTPNTLLAV